MRTLSFALAALALSACLGDEKGPEEEAPPDDSKEDSFAKPLDHGAIQFGVGATSALTATEHFHTWTFELSGDAKVDLRTNYAVLGQRRTDTVLYLYKWNGTSWGAYMARNDDAPGTTYSKLVENLGAGKYRALVKGHLASTTGKFKLTVDCTGAGCAPPPPPAPTCLFGAQYHDIDSDPNLQIDNRNVITQATLSTLLPAQQAMLVAAMKDTGWTEVTTASEALSHADGGEANFTWLSDTAGRRSFLAIEYGAGDNSYGAFFDQFTGAMVSQIHDGDLYTCTVSHETCQLPEDYQTLKSDPAFVHGTDKAVTSATSLSATEKAQVTDAVQRVYGPATTLASGIQMADDHTVDVRTYKLGTTDLTVVEFGAGDTSVGGVYKGTTTELAGRIEDSFIYGCTLFSGH